MNIRKKERKNRTVRALELSAALLAATTVFAAGVTWADPVESGFFKATGDTEATANTTKSVAAGNAANAEGTYSVAVGDSASASGVASIAIGSDTVATNNSAIAIGNNAEATSQEGHTSSLAIGAAAKATADSTLAIGHAAKASVSSSYAIGFDANASASHAMALGTRSISSGTGSVAIGVQTEATAEGAISIGSGSKATEHNTIAIGHSARTTDEEAIQIGSSSLRGGVEGFGSIAVGNTTTAKGQWYATAMGYQSLSLNDSASSYGASSSAAKNSVAIGAYSHAGTEDEDLGGFTLAKEIDGATNATAVGYNTNASGKYASAIGSGANATNEYATATGVSSQATGWGSAALSGYAKATNTYATAAGMSSKATGYGASALGAKSEATANYASAVGYNSSVTVADGVALGSGSVADVASGDTGYDPATGAASTNTGKTWKSTMGAVSVGNSSNTRQIINVAAGSRDTDAVNVAQLKQVVTVANNAKTHYYSVNSTATGTGSNYDNDGATGIDAIAAGPNAKATGNYAVAIGYKAHASGDHAVAFGSSFDVVASGQYAFAHGQSSNIPGEGTRPVSAIGPNSTAWGVATIAGQNDEDRAATWQMLSEMDNAGEPGEKNDYGINTTAWGFNNKAYGTNSTAFGQGNVAYGIDSVAFGTDNTTYGRASTAWGEFNVASGYNSTAFGQGTEASGYQATAFGVGTVASGANTATAFGNDTTASGYFASTAFGMSTTASSTASTAFGSGTTASGAYSTAFGANTYATNNYATAWGASNTASGQAATAFGNATQAKGNMSTAFGARTTASSNYATAFGLNNTASNQAATAFGNLSIASGVFATAFGQNTEASGKGATAFGIGTANEKVTASGVGATAFGSSTVASGDYSTAFGVGSKAYGNNSLAALGGIAGVAPDGETAATGNGSVAIGVGATALKDNTYAIGQNASVTVDNGVALGNSASVTAEGGVALGSSSTANVASGVAGYDPVTGQASTDTTRTWKSTLGAVSVGDGSNTRQIINVAAGTEDTDAVNVAQLKAAQIHYYSTNDGGTKQGNYNNDAATGTNALAAGPAASAAGNNATALGAQATASGANATAAGVAAAASQENAIAVGVQAAASGINSGAYGVASKASAQNALAFGTQAAASGENSAAFGVASTASAQNALAFGTQAAASGVNAIAIGIASQASNQAAAAVGTAAKATGLGSSAFGTEAAATGDHSAAFGASSSAGGLASTALGVGAQTSVGNATAVGAESQVSSLGGVALGWNSVAATAAGKVGYDITGTDHSNDSTGTWKSTSGAVSVGGGTKQDGSKVTRQIINVAAGTEDTDAVNVAQLKQVASAAAGAAENARTHYYSVNDKVPFLGAVNKTNYNNDGATGTDSLAAGVAVGTNGQFSSVAGAYSSVAGSTTYQGTGASVFGSFNEIGAQDGAAYDGVGNSVVGLANSTSNANGALIFGTGNKITNSYGALDDAQIRELSGAYAMYAAAVKRSGADSDAAKTAFAALKAKMDEFGKSAPQQGGDVLAIGGGNTADYAKKSSMIGVGNSITGTADAAAEFNSTIGYNNTIKNGSNNSIIGTNRTVSGASGVVVMGAASKAMTTNVDNAVVIGTDANVTTPGGVAVGWGSISDRAAGVQGANPLDVEISEADAASAKWKSTAGAFSIGGTLADGTVITRQITGVAAGTEDTDAVNVAQLKRIALTAGEGVNIGEDNSINIDAVTRYAGDFGEQVSVSLDNVLTVKGSAASEKDLTTGNIGVVTDPQTKALLVKLNKDVDLGDTGSVTVGDTTVSSGTVQLGDAVTIDQESGVTISGGPSGDISISSTAVSMGGNRITNVAPGVDPTDAVNMSQLMGFTGGWYLAVEDGDADKVAGDTVRVVVEKNEPVGDLTTDVLSVKKTVNDDGEQVVSFVVADAPTFGGMVTAGGLTVKAKSGDVVINNNGISAGGNKITNVAKGDVNKSSTDAVNGSQLYDLGDSVAQSFGGTSVYNSSTGKVEFNVKLDETGSYNDISSALQALDTKSVYKHDVTMEKNLTVSGTFTANGPAVFNEQVTMKKGLDMGGTKITNLAPGVDDTDAVNMSQLKAIGSNINYQINKMDRDISYTGSRAAALAALHPLPYDPDKPTSIMAGVGHYRGASSVALGVAHHFNDDTLLTVGSTVGRETMLNVGLSLRVGRNTNMTEKRWKAMRYSAANYDAKIKTLEEENSSLRKRLKSLENSVQTLLDAKGRK